MFKINYLENLDSNESFGGYKWSKSDLRDLVLRNVHATV